MLHLVGQPMRVALVVCLCLWLTLAVTTDARKHKLHRVLTAQSTAPQVGLEERATEFGVRFITEADAAAVAHAHARTHNARSTRPNPPPTASPVSANGLSDLAAESGVSVAPQPAVQGASAGQLSGLHFRLHSRNELEQLLRSAQANGMKVVGASEAMAEIEAKGLFNSRYMDARVQLEAGKRSAMFGAVKEACKEALDQLQLQVGVAVSLGTEAEVQLSVALTCGNLRVCGVCLYKALVGFLVPGYGSVNAVGSDHFVDDGNGCGPQLMTWCNGILNQWICEMDALEGISDVSDSQAVAEARLKDSTKFCDDAMSSTGTRAKCVEFTRFLRPIRPDMMRRMRCNLNSGANKHWRRFAALGRGVLERMPVPFLRGWAINKADRQHSRWAVESSFSCPRNSHDRVQEVCNYFMPMLQIPQLNSCGRDEHDQKISDKPDSTNTNEPKPKSGFECLDEGIGKLKDYVSGQAFSFGAKPEQCPKKLWDQFTTLASQTKQLDAITAKCPDTNGRTLPVCQAQALTCAAVAKATAMNSMWETEGKKGGNWVFVQKVDLKEMCASVGSVSHALKLRCERFVDNNKALLPLLLLEMGCAVKDSKASQDELTEKVVTCFHVDSAEKNRILSNAFKACMSERSILQLPILAQCVDSDFDLKMKPIVQGTAAEMDDAQMLHDYLQRLVQMAGTTLGADERAKSSLFYRVLADGNSEWNVADIKKSTVLISGQTEAGYCQYVVHNELFLNNNGPCKTVTAGPEREKCEAARAAIDKMTGKKLKKLKQTIVPFAVQQSESWKWKADGVAFAKLPAHICNQLKLQPGVQNTMDQYFQTLAQFVPVPEFARANECDVCTDLIGRMARKGFDMPARSTVGDAAITWLTAERLKYMFGTSLYRLTGKWSKTESDAHDAFVALDAYLQKQAVTGQNVKNLQQLTAVAQTLYETLRTLPSGEIVHVPAPFSTEPVVTVTPAPWNGQGKKPKDVKTSTPAVIPQGFTTVVAAAGTQLRTAFTAQPKDAFAERVKFWCQLALPQCAP